MRLISILVERVSEVTIFVPSDRTTFSNGLINKANGKLSSMISISVPACFQLKHSRQTLDDHKGNKGIGCDSTNDAFFMVFRQTAQNKRVS
jgi:hypothetical protein